CSHFLHFFLLSFQYPVTSPNLHSFPTHALPIFQSIAGQHSSLPTRFSDSRRVRRWQGSFRRKSTLRIERAPAPHGEPHGHQSGLDRKSTRMNSSHFGI